MAVDVLLGLQWGDEGKGKIVDYLSKEYDIVARFQGGPNAGHTLEFDGRKHVLHQIPSGVFHTHIVNIIGNGVILDPIVFKNKEAKNLLDYGIDITKNLLISKKAQIIIPTHRLLDRAYENAKGDNKIGSTLKGIGPTYQDKIGRNGIRIGDLVTGKFQEKYEALKKSHIQILDFYGEDYSELPQMEAEFFECLEFFHKFQLIDSEIYLNKAISEGKTVLAEGAQGSLLDIDFGTYPFVTSSNTIVAGACTGLGIAPQTIGKVIGIFKAYCTRVGSGPFPTELIDEVGEKIRQEGREFGSTTGRPRRCGWVDLPALKYANMLNGVTEMLMMKTDVLNIFEEIDICTHYKLKSGEVIDYLPYDLAEIAEPIYVTMKGWNCNLAHVKEYNAFPQEVKDYVAFLEKELKIRISTISIGPDRTETVRR